MSFSQRMGFESGREAIQLNSIDSVLRMALYNSLQGVFVAVWYFDGSLGKGFRAGRTAWTDFWHRPADEFSDSPYNFIPDLKNFILAGHWNRVYDYIEFILTRTDLPLNPDDINRILEREMSGYRLRGKMFVPISDVTELAAIDQALGSADRFRGARQHVSTALKSLSQKPNPDFRNAITEAISAVESAARVVAGKHKATLGDALKVLEKEGRVHPALKDAWLKIYGYSSDEHGLRHAMTEDPNIDFRTAKYMVVSCAAFVNLLSTVR